MLFQIPYAMFNYKTYIIFLVASLVVSIGIQMVLPFPYGLGVALALFIAFPFFLRRRYMGKMRGTGGSMFGMGANSEYSSNRPLKSANATPRPYGNGKTICMPILTTREATRNMMYVL